MSNIYNYSSYSIPLSTSGYLEKDTHRRMQGILSSEDSSHSDWFSQYFKASLPVILNRQADPMYFTNWTRQISPKTPSQDINNTNNTWQNFGAKHT